VRFILGSLESTSDVPHSVLKCNFPVKSESYANTRKTLVTKGYKHLTQEERDRIQSLLDQGVDEAEIGRIIGRHKSTVGREIDSEIKRAGARYRSPTDTLPGHLSQPQSLHPRLYAKYQGKKIQEHKELREYVIRGLKRHWNPDEIAGAMKLEKQPFYASKTTIYEWLYSEWDNHIASTLTPASTNQRSVSPRPSDT
jgi:IS30 family transposase